MVCKADSGLQSSNKGVHELHTISRLLTLDKHEVPTYTIPSLLALHNLLCGPNIVHMKGNRTKANIK